MAMVDTMTQPQVLVCRQLETSFVVCKRASTVMVSRGVLGGSWPLQGIRYPQTLESSGWVLWTGRRSMRGRTFQKVIAADVCVQRMAAWQFMALPVGWRFLFEVDGRVASGPIFIGADKGPDWGDADAGIGPARHRWPNVYGPGTSVFPKYT